MPIKFKDLVKKERGSVIEVLQLWGDLDNDEKRASQQDWQHLLMEHMAALSEADESDPAVIACMRKKLARIVAACEAWDKQLKG